MFCFYCCNFLIYPIGYNEVGGGGASIAANASDVVA
jgi:hypothetical protein